jgi:uncharacterized protein DUF935
MAKRILQLEFSDSASGISYTGPSPVAQVSILKNLQPTEPSIPLKRAFPRATLGDSGTRMLHGIITEEYNPELQGVEGVKIYDEMRKNDGTVRAAMLVCTLPIRRAEWFVKPGNETPEAEEQANFIKHALFDWLDLNWDDVLRQALLMCTFGVMLFEKVYGTYDDPDTGKTYVTLTRLAPRLPKSILMWELVDQTFGIQQIRQDGQLAQIPGSKMLIFCNEREGDNWWGTSMLRAAYKHWYYKNNFYKIDAVAFERQGLGVPYIKMPEGYTADDEKNAKVALSNLRASEDAYMVLPPDYEFAFADMGSKSTRDPKDSIEHHNKEILQSVLAQFLELGAAKSSSGSRALSQDHSDLFLKAMEAIANTVRDVFTKDCIKELIDLNFDDVKVYPVMDYSGITKVDVAALGTALGQLATAGFIDATNDDQQWVRAALGMPPRTQEQIDEADADDESSEELEVTSDVNEDIEDDGSDDDDAAPPTAPKPKPKKPAGKNNAKPPAGNKTEKVEKNAKDIKSKPSDSSAPTSSKTPAKPAPKAHEHRSLKRKFDDGHGFMSWRPLTFAETRVDWQKIQDTMDEMESDFSDSARELLNGAKVTFMSKIHKAIEDGDTKAITELEIAFVSQYKTLVKSAILEAYDFGKNKASNELGIAVPASNAQTLASFDLLADTIANKTASDLESQAKLSAANAIKTDQNPLQAAGSIDADLDTAIDKAVTNTSPTIIGEAINNGRNDVFERSGGMIHALQRSEILDQKTCNFCMSMDGRVIDPGDDWGSSGAFHSNCRGIWVAILKEEENPPEIEGIPSNLGDYYGGEVNSLVQPPKPIVKPGGLADQYLKKQAARETPVSTP